MECHRQLSPNQVPTPKTNHVSTVLLYDIPIVSLYIECQERLCLAQISNTLLKQFSYNEIHNRRVALGITCVQCTPVQLEILRRAGAMPVSSRRCGMITRREAERLCKSFLGDNAPPRLPEDFAFSVHHKCAWGCRGSFLPSRYNSSRAKCIKCTYCGLFFSPNKFIFHSHRISSNDKYIQPDAANFNSWRRHMMLSAHPREEIVHAWEDVKAMFNGGTRKRLMASHSLMSSTSSNAITHKILDEASGRQEAEESHNLIEDSSVRLSPKRVKDNSLGVTAAAVVGVTAVAAAVGAVAKQLPIRPFNMHPNAVSSLNLCSSGIPESDIAIMPFSRSFMMDYMWHAHAVQNAAHIQQHQQKCGTNSGNTKTEAFSFSPNCSLQTWIKDPTANGNSSLMFSSAASATKSLPFQSGHESDPAIYSSSHHNTGSPSSTMASPNLSSLKSFHEPMTAIPQLLNASAFKPVLQLQKQHHQEQQKQQQQQQHHQVQQHRTLNSVRTVAAAVSATATLVSTTVYSSKTSATVSLTTSLSSLSSSSSSSSSCSSTSSMSNVPILPTSVVSPTFVNHTRFCTTPNALLRLLPPPVPALHNIPIETLDSVSTLTPTAEKLHLRIASENSSVTPPFIICSGTNCIKESHSSEDELETEDDIMVDIETTEEDQQQLPHQAQQQRAQTTLSKCSSQLFIKKYEPSTSMDDIDVDGDSDRSNEEVSEVVSQTQLEDNARDVNYESERFGVQANTIESDERSVNESSSLLDQHGTDSTTSTSSSIEIVENSNTNDEALFGRTIIKKTHALNNMDKFTKTTSQQIYTGGNIDNKDTNIINCRSPCLKTVRISSVLTNAKLIKTLYRKQQTSSVLTATAK